MVRKPKLSPRKQTVQARSAVTVEIIVEAAARILEERGLEGYTTNAVADRAGVSIGSLYQYFPNKDAITIALIHRETADLFADIERASSEDDWRNALALMTDAGVAHQLRRPALARLLDIEEDRLPNHAREKSVIDVIHPALTSVLQKANPKTDIDLETLAFDVMAITRGMTDMAGIRRELDGVALRARTRKAVFGYLGLTPPKA
ncbi:TetR/AcrR family transcriptional regulator [Rhizobium tropici]|uniref:TetR/AcrR family transcriptional regulator n=1 Tax=Rhizobium tropici TaxID=398 RepID=A0A329YCB7_RHITR|nr:TetR/AcrR family transcriptional regulator [Rhizobium tropici]RAX41096.1 TetR/AcrR family transcriptional regulator [Rhizobium tropici]